ncbi:MAG: hypothetical protein A3K19_15910 [Lentisphaerae bacterium RIFOXYB12_FULL_65_16]|nr:MAG: hypothetical protein A3K18_06055 [Lentisphaerae bacterium RIFOXYA12_64_32]OGV87310.1 MAG: hypothetical protein A3K19_15910 [Lentisphaerae bacterium RIFOXYB12_FULL_65_16]
MTTPATLQSRTQTAPLAVVVLLLAWTAHAGSNPKLVCDEPVFEFGTRSNSMTIEHVFKIRNTGKAALLLRKVRTTCGCTVAKLARDTVEPDGEAEVHVSLSLAGRTGEQRKTIYVESNDPGTPTLQLELHGTAFAEIEVRPREGAFFGKLSRTDTVEKDVRIVASDSTTFHVTGVILDSPALEYELSAIQPGKEYSLRIRVRSPRPVGELAVVARVLTDHPRYAEVPVPIRLITEQDVYAVPRVISLRQEELASPELVRHVLIRTPSGEDFHITGIEKPLESLDVKVAKLRNGCFRLEVRGFPLDQTLNDKVIRVTTDVQNCPPLEIPIRIQGGRASAVTVPSDDKTGPAALPGAVTEKQDMTEPELNQEKGKTREPEPAPGRADDRQK